MAETNLRPIKSPLFRQRPLKDCACPDAIAKFEGRYFASAHRHGQPGTRMLQPDDEDAKSESIDGASEDKSEADDRHLDEVPSDDSIWGAMEDSQGRSATSPTGKCTGRLQAAQKKL